MSWSNQPSPMDWEPSYKHHQSLPRLTLAGTKRTYSEYSSLHEASQTPDFVELVKRVVVRSFHSIATNVIRRLGLEYRAFAIERSGAKRRVIAMPGAYPSSPAPAARSLESVHNATTASSPRTSRTRSAPHLRPRQLQELQGSTQCEDFPTSDRSISARALNPDSEAALHSIATNFLQITNPAQAKSPDRSNDVGHMPNSVIKPKWRAEHLRRMRQDHESQKYKPKQSLLDDAPQMPPEALRPPLLPPSSPSARNESLKTSRSRPSDHRLAGTPPVDQPAPPDTSNDLSFLPDAAPARHVSFEKSAWLGVPFPRIHKYVPGERINHPLSPYGRRSFTKLRESESNHEDSSVQATPVAPRLPKWESPEAPGTTDVAELEEELKLFEISNAVRRSRRLKEEERKKKEQEEAAAEEAARRKALVGASVIARLTPEWERKVDEAMAAKRPGQSYPNTSVNRHDLGTVLPQSSSEGVGWLNDEIVNEYLSAMTSRALARINYKPNPDKAPPIHAFSTHLYNTWKQKKFAGVARWFKRAKMEGSKLLSVKTILVPINDASHWTLLIVSGTRKTVEYYDSLGGRGTKYVDFALDFVKGNLGDKAFKQDEWKVLHTPSARQTNGMDCGVFVCMNALALVLERDPSLAVPSGEMPLARRQVAATLLNGGFKGDFEF